MQALKYLTTPNASTTQQRPIYGGNENTNIPVTNFLSEQLSIFLTECGVENVSWEQKEGQSWPWIYIWGQRFLLALRGDNYGFLGMPDIGKNFTLWSSSYDYKIYQNCPFVFSFTGNPKQAFVIRIMKQPWPNNQINNAPGILFAKMENSLSGEGIVSVTQISSSSSIPASYLRYSDGVWSTLGYPYAYSYDAFHSHGLANSVPLSERGTEWFKFKGVYLWPSGLIIEGNQNHILYQREVVIGTHRYIVLKQMDVGMIRLEDDDPGITENELLGGGG